MSDNNWPSNSGPGWQSKDGKFYDTVLEKNSADRALNEKMAVQEQQNKL